MHERDSKHNWSLSTVMFPQQTHDAFARGALGKSAERIWRLILTEPMKAAAIAKRLRVHRSNVGRALRKLETYGLVVKSIDGRWVGNAAGSDYLAEVAARCGTWGKAERRKQQHMDERARDVTLAILERKREWEMKI